MQVGDRDAGGELRWVEGLGGQGRCRVGRKRWTFRKKTVVVVVIAFFFLPARSRGACSSCSRPFPRRAHPAQRWSRPCTLRRQLSERPGLKERRRRRRRRRRKVVYFEKMMFWPSGRKRSVSECGWRGGVGKRAREEWRHHPKVDGALSRRRRGRARCTGTASRDAGFYFEKRSLRGGLRVPRRLRRVGRGRTWITVLGVESVAELVNTRSNLVESDGLLAPIALDDEHCNHGASGSAFASKERSKLQ